MFPEDNVGIGCVAVIFSSVLAEDAPGYAAMGQRMEELARRQPGFLGVESVRGADRNGITVSYWKTREDAARWKQVGEHLAAQAKGREEWYLDWKVRVCRVEEEWGSEKNEG